MKWLLCNREDLGLNPWHPHEKLGVVTGTCNPGRAGGGRQRQEDPYGLAENIAKTGSSKVSEDPVSKKKWTEEDFRHLVSTLVRTYLYTQMHAYVDPHA